MSAHGQGRKAVHFGAGNIGRGFIGLLLSRSGYEVTFVARNEKQIALLRSRRQYTVTLANETEDAEVVRNVTAIPIQDDAAVRAGIDEADVVTTAVGESALAHIAGAIASGIEYRLGRHRRPLRIIACENAAKGSSKLKKHVYALLKPESRALADGVITFPNAIVDRIVPPQPAADMLNVKVEPFFEWLIERGDPEREEPLPIEGARYVASLEPYAERKLYTVNAGHCAAAYFGHLHGCRTIPEAMKDEKVRRKVAGVMEETGRLLVHKYNWSEREHGFYIRKSMQRFANPRIADKVVRVGRSPLRKLSKEGRLVAPALQAAALGMETPRLVALIAAAMRYDAPDDPEAAQLQACIREKGVRHLIRSHLGIADPHPLHFRIADEYRELTAKRAGQA